jgi:small-conductance mechanosensitive channel
VDKSQNLGQHSEKLIENLNTELNKLSNSFELPSLLHLFLATLVFAAFFYFLNLIFKKLDVYTEDLKKQRLKPLTFKNIVLVELHNLASTLDFILETLKLAVNIFIIYAYITYAFGIFPATQGIASKLISYVLNLFSNSFISLINFIPNLLTIAFIVFVTFHILKLGRFLSRSLYFRQIIFPGFKKEWVVPTYDIAKFFIIVFAIIMVFPYLPGSDSPAFMGISVFVGVLLTLGSSSAIANIIAGVVLIYMSPFKVGDKVKVGEVTGNISEMGLLVTRVETIKNEQVTIPNSLILTKETINYTASAKSENHLIIPIPVTIGYDVSKDKVKSLLLESSIHIKGVLNEPKAFVLLTELDGSFISYELNVYTKQANDILQIKSDLRESELSLNS